MPRINAVLSLCLRRLQYFGGNDENTSTEEFYVYTYVSYV